MNEKINPEWEALQDKPHFVPLCCTPDYCKMIEELVRKHALAVEDLTERQFVEAIRQAIACGDFQKLVCTSNNSQLVVYIPFATEARLQARIKELVEQLRLAKSLCTVCGEYLPGHATGGADNLHLRMNELESLRRIVEMTERIRDGYRNNLLEHVAYSVSLFQPRELTNSERYVLAMAERQVIEAKLAYREAYLRLLAKDG